MYRIQIALFMAVALHAQIAFVQSRSNDNPAAGQTTLQIPIVSTLAKTSMIAWCGEGLSTADNIGVTDSAGNMWTLVAYATHGANRDGLFYTNGAPVTAANCNYSVPETHPRGMVWEVTGYPIALDGAAVSPPSTGTPTTCISGILNLTAGRGMPDFMVLACDINNNEPAFTAGPGFTIPNGAPAPLLGTRLGMEYALSLTESSAMMTYPNAGAADSVFAAFYSTAPPPSVSVLCSGQTPTVDGQLAAWSLAGNCFDLPTGPAWLTFAKGACPAAFPGAGLITMCETVDGNIHLRDGDTMTDKVIQTH
jgi:hypothetical protein